MGQQLGTVEGAVPRRALAPAQGLGRHAFMLVVKAAVGVFGLILLGLFLVLLVGSWPSLRRFGLPFLWTSRWDPVANIFGGLPFIYGTVVSSLIALLLAAFIGILSALFLAEFAPRRLSGLLGVMIELLAAVPSVVFGLWGLFVLAPVVQNVIGPGLQAVFGFLPIFQGVIYGVNMLTAAFILTLMIVPTVMSISRDLVAGVPGRYREATLALGSTRWEAVRYVVLPMVKPGVFGACMLALGRALGETIATTMVIGNRPSISVSLFAPGYTIASAIANEFTEATSNLYVSALIELGLLLLLISILINAAGRLFLARISRDGSRA